jgi:hypothetical protein
VETFETIVFNRERSSAAFRESTGGAVAMTRDTASAAVRAMRVWQFFGAARAGYTRPNVGVLVHETHDDVSERVRGRP